ncbi:MAG: hypothetical protein MRK01_11410 [Candidatus Scalindua sp.]|nr:hypothetical protein [Candidatus Scalindua sp.]
MKKYKILLFLIAVPLLGFGNEQPEKVLIKYLKAFYSNNHKKAYIYLSNADKKIVSKEEFIRKNRLEDPFQQEIAKAISALSSYEITETRIGDGSATAYTTITSPDMPEVLAEIFGPFYGPKDMKTTRQAMRHMLKQYLRKADVPMVEKSGEFELVQEDGKWKIFLNLGDNN